MEVSWVQNMAKPTNSKNTYQLSNVLVKKLKKLKIPNYRTRMVIFEFLNLWAQLEKIQGTDDQNQNQEQDQR